MSRPRVSVVVPAHDAERFVTAALESLFAELPADGEVIVVDDGSRDRTRAALAPFRDRVRLLVRDTSAGPGPARDLGASEARGEILAFHDADDLVLPGRLSSLLALLEEDPQLDIAFGNGVRISTDGRPLGPVIPARYARRLRRRTGPRELIAGSFLYPQAMLIRREAFARLGGFGPGVRRGELATGVAEDWNLAIRASLACRIRFLDRAVFAYRRHPASTTEEHALACAEANLATLEALAARFPELGIRAGTRRLNRELARRLARCARHYAGVGRPAEARAALARAVALDPTSLRLHWRRLRQRPVPREAIATAPPPAAPRGARLPPRAGHGHGS